MSTVNPYKTPESDLGPPPTGETDRTSVFSPSGRFGRLSYIAWGTLLYLAAMLIVALMAWAGLMTTAPGQTNTLEIVVSIPVAAIGLLFGIRRLHDIDARGWWILLSLVPLVNIGLALVLLLKAGTPAANNFGPPRLTPTWERVVGIIGVVLILLSLVAVVAALLIPMIVGMQNGA